MKENRSLGSRILRRFRAAPAQSMVEFALALPVLLLMVFGVIEFGRLLQAWLALENGARFGIRYAVTGEYNVQYCDEAATALSLTTEDPDHDCKVEPAATATDAEKALARDQTQMLQDWARLPSIRDAAMSGASGIAYDASASGDYLQYMAHPSATFDATYRGNPSLPGFFYISTCSNRHVTPTSGTDDNTKHFYTQQSQFDPFYFPGHSGDDDYLYYPTVCTLYDSPISAFMDDAGGPGDRVRITLTYRHNMIMPLISDWWPTLRLNTSRDGIVEKFRTSRVTGLSEGNMIPDTPTFTPTATETFTVTSTATDTSTPTSTMTPTNTLVPCVTDGNGIRAEYYNWTGWAPPSDPFTSPIVVDIVPQVNYDWGSSSPATGVGYDDFAIRFVGQVMPLYTERYRFYARSDDGQRLWVNGTLLVNNWTNQSASEKSGYINLERCQKYDIVYEYYEDGGSASARLRWQSDSQSRQVIPQANLFADLGDVATATITMTPTVTLTSTITLTPTITLSPTITLTPTRTGTNTRTLIPSATRTRTLVPTRTNTLPPTRTYTVTRTSPPTITDTPTTTSTTVPTRTNTSIPPTRTHTSTAPTPTRTVSPTFKPVGG